jgi:hypothetical protein
MKFVLCPQDEDAHADHRPKIQENLRRGAPMECECSHVLALSKGQGQHLLCAAAERGRHLPRVNHKLDPFLEDRATAPGQERRLHRDGYKRDQGPRLDLGAQKQQHLRAPTPNTLLHIGTHNHADTSMCMSLLLTNPTAIPTTIVVTRIVENARSKQPYSTYSPIGPVATHACFIR